MRTRKKTPMIQEHEKLPFTAHLEELRRRLIASFAAVGIGFVLCYTVKETLFEILTRPLIEVMPNDGKIIFTGLPEAFFTYLKVSFLAGLMLSAPVLLYHFWMFVAPGLYRKERHLLLPILFLSSVFFVGGALFGYFVVFPFGFQFFLGFATEHIQALPSMREYLSFAAKLLLAFGLVFEMPLVITALARLGIVSPEQLKRFRKYAVVVFFAGSAIITPPDVVTQVMMALPLMLLYEISIFSARMFRRRKTASDDTEAESESSS